MHAWPKKWIFDYGTYEKKLWRYIIFGNILPILRAITAANLCLEQLFLFQCRKQFRVCFGFCSTTPFDFQNSRRFWTNENQNRSWRGRTRFPALGTGYLIDWSTALFRFFVIVQSTCTYDGFGFTTLIWKPLYVYQLSFCTLCAHVHYIAVHNGKTSLLIHY